MSRMISHNHDALQLLARSDLPWIIDQVITNIYEYNDRKSDTQRLHAYRYLMCNIWLKVIENEISSDHLYAK